MLYADRKEAGQALATRMAGRNDLDDAIILALPRGGVPVAYEVARALGRPLDVLVVRKLGVPGHEELAMGAVASGGVVVFNRDVLAASRAPQQAVDAAVERERAEVERREKSYRSGRAPVSLDGRTAVLIDDGLATGASMRAAIQAVRTRARRTIVAVPVGAEETVRALENQADEVICLSVERWLDAVGSYYRNFTQTTDEQVRALLDQATASQSI